MFRPRQPDTVERAWPGGDAGSVTTSHVQKAPDGRQPPLTPLAGDSLIACQWRSPIRPQTAQKHLAEVDDGLRFMVSHAMRGKPWPKLRRIDCPAIPTSSGSSGMPLWDVEKAESEQLLGEVGKHGRYPGCLYRLCHRNGNFHFDQWRGGQRAAQYLQLGSEILFKIDIVSCGITVLYLALPSLLLLHRLPLPSPLFKC